MYKFVGKLPEKAEKAFADAMKIVSDRQSTRMKEASRCGPECLSELLKRRGENVDVATLAQQMKSDEMGTTLQNLADTAKKYGFKPKGLDLTQNGLVKQPFPLIALVAPSHYVIVEKATSDKVTVWDSNMIKAGKPAVQTLNVDEWSKIWKGVALILSEDKTD
jgi:ABC-type bacteriocin/lantibiotic exporter with double-glycine peptidase domain